MNAQAVIISVGTELTNGMTVDTNSAVLSRRLAELGIVTVSHVTVGDDVDRIAAAITAAAADADVVIVTGGLGPTADDLTRQALAKAMDADLVLDEASLAEIQQFFQRLGRVMNQSNRVQAMRPEGTEALANPEGTAPGVFARLRKALVFLTPGVPPEMEAMLDRHLLPRLSALAGRGRLAFRAVRAFGAGESDIAAKLADLMRRDGNVLVGTTVGAGVVSVNVTAQAVHQDLADRIADETVNEICRRLGRWVYGTGDETLAGAVGGMLRRRHATLSVAESCTGGLLAQLVTDVSGASDYFVGGAICYSNRIKQDVVGVPAKVLQTHGAVSEQTAQAMARGARERFETTYALAITGIAGPAGGTETKPVGLVYTAIATPGQTRVQENYFHGDRTTIRMRSALTALNMLRQELTDTPDSQELAP